MLLADNKNAAADELIAKLRNGKITSHEMFEREKIHVAKKYGIGDVIRNADLISRLDKNDGLVQFLRTKPVRTLSGVANIAVMWLDNLLVGGKPYSCPFECVYCPQGSNAPKSYIGVEPTTLRAIRNNYDPYLQITNRLRQLHAIGHATDKCELIVMGGTFMAWRKEKRDAFIKRCYEAFNGKEASAMEEAQRANETAASRVIGLTIETRADYCRDYHIKEMLGYGATRVEIGVQSTDEELLKITKRGHTAAENMRAFKLLKDAGLKVTAHWMPGLTGLHGAIDTEKEIAMFKELFDNAAYRPDELKIYPVLVIPGTELYNLWKQGRYAPLTSEQAIDLLIELKKNVPRYVRIKRVSRDISEKAVESGAKTTNIRQLAHEKMDKLGLRCLCIRCREVGTQQAANVQLTSIEYEASGGKEIFLSFTGNVLVAFLRLRIDASDTAKIRELHVYGRMVPISTHGGYQHMGLGKRLMEEAERIAREHGKEKITVTSGVGAREYYRKLGYTLNGFYMEKNLQ
ncbi:MAG: tRNA uridine(34) 5-carboxymethylaminomethyl modification radical SAM/GNAT enzyme Elp3 [Candidatus Aenigmarchaeota archaeon]|nr:tRNA uridine(34) 5-carboxymethylaminomethyl modification radical SAM/GNAT enzyme Elp3 [Candidatus Aenigmarchaeota archaeon]